MKAPMLICNLLVDMLKEAKPSQAKAKPSQAKLKPSQPAVTSAAVTPAAVALRNEGVLTKDIFNMKAPMLILNYYLLRC